MWLILVNDIGQNDLTVYGSTTAEHYVLNGTEYNGEAKCLNILRLMLTMLVTGKCE